MNEKCFFLLKNLTCLGGSLYLCGEIVALLVGKGVMMFIFFQKAN